MAKFSKSPLVAAVKYHPLSHTLGVTDSLSCPFLVAPAHLTAQKGPRFPPSCSTWRHQGVRKSQAFPVPAQERTEKSLEMWSRGLFLRATCRKHSEGGFLRNKASPHHSSRACFSCIPSLPGEEGLKLTRVSSHSDGSSDESLHIDEPDLDLCRKPLLPRDALGHALDLGLTYVQHRCRLSPGQEGLAAAHTGGSGGWAPLAIPQPFGHMPSKSCFPQLRGGCGLGGLCRSASESPAEGPLPAAAAALPPLLPTVVPGDAGWRVPAPGVSPGMPGCGKKAHGLPCSPFCLADGLLWQEPETGPPRTCHQQVKAHIAISPVQGERLVEAPEQIPGCSLGHGADLGLRHVWHFYSHAA